jgi:hypothetical protein
LALLSNTTGTNNTVVGSRAGATLTTGTHNTFIGSGSTDGAGFSVTTGSKNTILGGYTGNQGGLDIRTSSNNIVLSDGDGNPRGIFNSTGVFLVGQTTNALADTGHILDPAGVAYHIRDGNAPLILNRKTSDGDIAQFYKDGTTVGSIGSNSGYLYLGSPVGDDAYVWMGADAIAPSTSSGGNRDNAISLGTSAARFKDLYLSGGVYLGGTGSANLLDDYEEGTFTPTLTGGFSSAPTSYTFNSGTYTKIGRYVYFAFDLQASGATADGTALSIGGLPFANIGAGFGGASYSYQLNFNTIATDMYHITFNSSEIDVYDVAGAPRAGNAAGININARVILFGSYQTAA